MSPPLFQGGGPIRPAARRAHRSWRDGTIGGRRKPDRDSGADPAVPVRADAGGRAACIRTASGGDRFSALAREFFSRLTQRCLDYYLSRELNNHIGPDARFRDDRARSEFDGALDQHCREASRIVEAFAGGWYGKNVYQGDGLTPDSIRKFAPVAFRKIRAELRKRRDADQ